MCGFPEYCMCYYIISFFSSLFTMPTQRDRKVSPDGLISCQMTRYYATMRPIFPTDSVQYKIAVLAVPSTYLFQATRAVNKLVSLSGKYLNRGHLITSH